MSTHQEGAKSSQDSVCIGPYTFEEFGEVVTKFHGYAAPGLFVGGFMVELAKRHIPEGVLFDAIAETWSCLPDAVQLLTPCTAGNGWLRVHDLGRYALSLFDKRTGEGVRVFLDQARLDSWPTIREWYLKLKPKREQDSDRLREEMRLAGESVLTLRPIRVKPGNLGKKSKGVIAVCPLCAEAYPARHGAICLGCQGEAPVLERGEGMDGLPVGCSGEISPELAGSGPRLVAVPVEQAVGRKALHDMTRIEPGQSKGPEFHRGQVLTAGDVCRLQHMGRHNVYVLDEAGGHGDSGRPDAEWIHEDEAARAFAAALAGEGTVPAGPPREGKVKLKATRDGLLVVDEGLLEAFNLVPDVMAATRHSFSLVREGQEVGGTRAVPLHLSRPGFEKAMAVLRNGGEASPVLSVRPLRQARVGILVTGTEVFQGLIEDKFIPIVSRKAEDLGCSVVGAVIRPDDLEAIKSGVAELLAAGTDLLVTTAGLSVDPDDVTRKALAEAGVEDMLYGMPLLPGTMTLVGRIRGNGGNGNGQVQVLGIPACALFFKTTSLDLLLPRLLAGVEVTRRDLARMGHGGYCLNCKVCDYPHCPFGR